MMDAMNETILRISPEKAMITVEDVVNGVVRRKEISKDTLLECLRVSLRSTRHCSGLLPENCLSVEMGDGIIAVTILYTASHADIRYHDTLYEHFPLPRLVFSFDVTASDGVVQKSRLGVIDTGKATPETKMFRYPFSNVDDSRICTGKTPLPKYKRLEAIATLPNYIMGIPNNDHNYDSGSNQLGLGYRDLLEHLKDKEPDYYYGNILVPNGRTLKDFIDRRF